MGLVLSMDSPMDAAAHYLLDHAESLSRRSGQCQRSKLRGDSSPLPPLPLTLEDSLDAGTEEIPEDWKIRSRELEHVYRLQLERGDALTVTHKLFGTGTSVPDDLRLLRVQYYRPSLFADLFRNAAITFTFEHYPGRKTSLEEVAQLGVIVRQCHNPLFSIQFEQPTGAFVYGKLYELQQQLLSSEKRYLKRPQLFSSSHS